MLKKTITYKDYNGVERTEDFFFNLTETELVKWEHSKIGGLSNIVERMVKSENNPEIIRLFESIIIMAYGEKSEDGRSFIKDEKITKAFMCCPAYDILFMELCSDEKAMTDFINGVLPSDLAAKVAEAEKAKNKN